MDPTETARAIVAANRYMTLATADADGVPWVTPVWFAHEDLRELLWVSRPETRHSRNIAARPDIAISIFDGTQAISTGNGVYVEASAEQAGTDGIEMYSRCAVADGGRPWDADAVTGDAELRLYRARVQRMWVLDDRDRRVEVEVER